jgi:hypothetical protein
LVNDIGRHNARLHSGKREQRAERHDALRYLDGGVMKSLKDHFNELQVNDWQYYDQLSEKYCNYDAVIKNASRFLTDQFYYGGKENFLGDLGQMDKDETRSKHVINVFFLGHFIKKLLFSEKELSKKKQNSFNWHWFLLALFHDAGYTNNDEKEERLNDDLSFGYCCKTLSFLHSCDSIQTYYRERKKGQEPKYDHGIIGAECMFKCYSDMRKKGQVNGDHQIMSANNDLLSLGEMQLVDVCKLSKIIACHNMWTDNKYGIELKNLPQNFGYFEKLYMLLSICDTIETQKRKIDIEKIEAEIYNKSVTFSVAEDISAATIQKWNIRWINGLSEQWDSQTKTYKIIFAT